LCERTTKPDNRPAALLSTIMNRAYQGYFSATVASLAVVMVAAHPMEGRAGHGVELEVVPVFVERGD